MKKLLNYLFFAGRNKQKILFGPSSGMFVNYDIEHRSQHLFGLYEREIYPYLLKGIGKSDVLVDIGANDGYYVLAFMKSGKKVIACEPSTVVNALLKNLQLNDLFPSGNIIIERRLVGSKTSPEYISAKLLVNDFAGNKFFLVDIDGGELDLLYSCHGDFDHKSSTWLIETHSKELEDSCIEFFLNRKYIVTVIKNAWWRIFIPEKRPLEHNRWLFAEPA